MNLYKQWDECWKNDNNNLTFIGKKILKEKQKVLSMTISNLDVNSVIDVGCGLGYMLEVFKSKSLNAVGIDVSNTAVSVCRKKKLNAKHIKLEDVTEKYDLVFSDGLLEHFRNYEQYVKLLCNITNKYVVIIQTDHEEPMTRFLLLMESLFKKGQNMYEYNFRIDEFSESFNREGLKKLRVNSIYFNAFKLIIYRLEK